MSHAILFWIVVTLVVTYGCDAFPMRDAIRWVIFNLTTLLVNIYKYVQRHLKITNRQRRERD